MSDATQLLEVAITEAWPLAAWADAHVVVAVSGGADSCALLAAVARLKAVGAGEIVAAHLHHGLRGAAADADAAFVEQLGMDLGVPVVVGHGDVATAAGAQGDGIEAAARAARYQFLLETAERRGARYVATAHTADDQAETILHRIVRGTGIAGLAGMRAARPLSPTVTLVRPMLALRRREVLAYLADSGLTFREDETNAELRFTRNRIRHELLPRLRADYNAEVDAALVRLGQLARENQNIVNQLVEGLLAATVRCENGEVVVASPAHERSPYLIRELFVAIWRRENWPQQSMGYDEWNALAAMLLAAPDASPQQRIFPGNIQATKKGEQLALTRL